MNNTKSVKLKSSGLRRMLALAAGLVLTAALAIGGAAAFAGESLLSPGASEVTSGQSLSFKVNLGDVKEAYATEAFTLTVNISPAPQSVSVSPDVNISQYGSKYTVSSADLTDVSGLTFTVYPGSVTAETTYTVSASIAGSLDTPSGSFTFTAKPEEQSQGGSDVTGGNTGEKGNTAAGGKAAMKAGKMSKSAMSGSSAGSVSAASSTDTSTVYKGSADNYLKKLSVEGYEFTKDFNKTRDTYFMYVPEDVESVTVNATASDSSAAVRVAGADSITEEMSKIMISVTADNGDVRVYRIYVTHKAAEDGV